MGCSLSTQYQDIALVAQAQPIAAIDPRHCDPHRCVTLRQEFRTFTTGRTLVDAHTGVKRFAVKAKLLSGRMTLLDAANKAPIATFKQKVTFFSKPTILVHAGCDSSGPELFQLHAVYYRGGSTSVQVVFTNVWTRQRCELGFVGDWRFRDGFFWLDRGLTGVREPVARLNSSGGFAAHKLQVDIAPNMDAALIAMLCSILADKEWRVENRD
ncbi:hypothetical protein Gpo141_00008546 [Globisporangium polare]